MTRIRGESLNEPCPYYASTWPALRYQPYIPFSSSKSSFRLYHSHVFPLHRNNDYATFYCLKLSCTAENNSCGKRNFRSTDKVYITKIAGNISSRSGMMRKSLENAQKRSNYLAFVFAVAGRGAGPSWWEKKREIPECKSEFFTASSAAAAVELLLGRERSLLYWFCSKADPFQSIFSAGVLFTELLLPLALRRLWVLNPSPSSGWRTQVSWAYIKSPNKNRKIPSNRERRLFFNWHADTERPLLFLYGPATRLICYSAPKSVSRQQFSEKGGGGRGAPQFLSHFF